MSGEAEWIDKSTKNTINCAIDSSRLTIVEQPPKDMKQPRTTIKKITLSGLRSTSFLVICLDGKSKDTKTSVQNVVRSGVSTSREKEKLDRVIETITTLDNYEAHTGDF